MYFAPILFGSVYLFIILVMAISAITICRKDQRERENIMSIRERKRLAKIELMKQRERQQQRQYSSGPTQLIFAALLTECKRLLKCSKKERMTPTNIPKNKHNVLLQKLDALCENKRIIKNETNNRNFDEQINYPTYSIDRGSIESSLSMREPQISRKDLLLMTSKKAKEMAAIKRKHEEEISIANRQVVQEPDGSQRLHIRSNHEYDSTRRSMSERHFLPSRLPQTTRARKKHSITADAIAADLERQLGRAACTPVFDRI